jgi:two-component system NtrC family response regulator
MSNSKHVVQADASAHPERTAEPCLASGADLAEQSEIEPALEIAEAAIAQCCPDVPVELSRGVDRSLMALPALTALAAPADDVFPRLCDAVARDAPPPTEASVLPFPIRARPGKPGPGHPESRSRDHSAWDTPRKNGIETCPTDPQDDSVAGSLGPENTFAHLRILTGSPHAVHVFSSRKGVSIGRFTSDCELVVDDRRMSRRHARIEHSAAGWQLQDLGARNRGYVDGRGYSAGDRVALTDGAVLRFGNTLMVFRASPPTVDGKADSPSFPGISPVAVEVRRRIAALASGTGHVLIVGETGVGKERVAQAIGETRAPHPFVTVNSAELSHHLARSELFGHVKGAFTNATANKPGLVDTAGDGVLFLDEIGELSLDVQAELLRFLEDGSYRPLGSTELRHSNARVIAATHVDLDQAAQNGKFRRDLLARLRASNTPLELPPLRERREDILGWTHVFFRERTRDVGPNPWSVGALECLLLYPWTYNLRDLRGVVAGVVEQAWSFPCRTEHVPEPLRAHRGRLRAPVAVALPDESAPPRADPPSNEIELALRETHGNMRMTAQQLGIDRRKLYRLCKRYGLAAESYRAGPEGDDD